MSQLTDNLWTMIKSKRDRLSEDGGYKVAVDGVDKWFHSDAKSKTQQLALVTLGPNLPSGLQWKTMDGSFVAMTQTLALQVFAAAVTQDLALFQAAEEHKAAMLSAPLPAAYDFSGGWPSVYVG